MKLFVVSDVHSFYYKLRAALDENGWDDTDSSHVLLCCGDLFDRGQHPIELLGFVRDLANKSRFLYVRGNHEDLLEECVAEINRGVTPSYHHSRNGTVETICRLCGENEWIIYDPSQRDRVVTTMKPILEWIDITSKDYIQLGDYVFVHGWIPCKDYTKASSSTWKQARWANGMYSWLHPEQRLENKTIVCGHWHTSWGWSRIKNMYEEWPDLHNPDFITSFKPFIEDGIIAMDGCVAYSGKVNCKVFEFDGEKIL